MPDFVDLVTGADRRERYERLGLWDESTLAGRVGHHAATRPDATAVVDGSGRYSFAQLLGDAAALAGWLGGSGVEPGRVVSIQLPNRYEFVVAAVAAQSLGAVVNPLLPNYRARELVSVFGTARPAVIVIPGEYRGCDHRALVSEVADATGVDPRQLVVDGDPGSGGSGFTAAVEAGRGGTLGTGSAPAVSELIFTSGTEARPKAIMHTEQTANFSVRVARADLGVTDTDVVWMPSPLGHSTGFNYGMRFALYHGLPLVLQDRWDPIQALDLVGRERCSFTLAATTFLRDLVGAARQAGGGLESMWAFGCGGAPVPPGLVDEAGAEGVQVLRLYGSTEVLVATWNRPGSPADKRRSTDGAALTEVEVEVRDADGRKVEAGAEGELYVRGPNTCVGFFDDAERTSATFGPDGWVRSGDLVTVDADGYLTVVGRRKEIIIRGGINIAPREIEELLTGFDEVAQAAVVGLPDDRLGERMCACVVLVEGARLDFETMVRRLGAAGLAVYKLPERLEICDALPMTASGKIQKHQLVSALTGRAS
ncbi:MAG TPA: AMP-binding protein [Acidimicrobiales bacterium]|nr:AMP-binding protein [Acidimicrobiales bacterium]